MIRPANVAAIAAIYRHSILNTIITFAAEPVSPAEVTGRPEQIGNRTGRLAAVFSMG